jgi:hypothetical protein
MPPQTPAQPTGQPVLSTTRPWLHEDSLAPEMSGELHKSLESVAQILSISVLACRKWLERLEEVRNPIDLQNPSNAHILPVEE